MERAQTDRPRVDTPRRIGSYCLITRLDPTGSGFPPAPERVVRALDAALAEILDGAHATGVRHAGLSPATVLPAGDGPRLTSFGAVRN